MVAKIKDELDMFFRRKRLSNKFRSDDASAVEAYLLCFLISCESCYLSHLLDHRSAEQL